MRCRPSLVEFDHFNTLRVDRANTIDVLTQKGQIVSFIPPTSPLRGQTELELARERKHEIEAKAERYAQLHGDDDPTRSAGLLRRALRRVRAAIARQR